MNPFRLAEICRDALSNGEHALTFTGLTARAMEISERMVTEQDLAALRYYLRRAQHWLEKWNICTVLVTEFYFDHHHGGSREPRTAKQATPCCALHGRKAAGLRLMTRKDREDDILGITWLYLISRNASGMQSAILRRIAIEHSEGKLTLPKATVLLKNALAYKTPEHHVDELDQLIRRVKVRSGNWQLEQKNGAGK